MTASALKLAERVRRIEQQVRSLRDLHAAEQRETAQRIDAIARVHADEMELVLDELADVAEELDALAGPAPVGPDGLLAPIATAADPAAASPKRAQWLAEQEKRSHLTRRDLLRGRDRPEGDEPPSS